MPEHSPSPKVLQLHWAGADWRLIQPLIDEGKLPQLESVIENGCMGNLMSLSPSNSLLVTTSLSTGCLGDKHGILAYATVESEQERIRPVDSRDLSTSPLWQMVNNAGKKAISVGWPASYPATVFDNIVISDAFSRAQGANFEQWPLKTHSMSDSSLESIMTDLRLHPSEISPEQILPFIPDAKNIDQETDERLPLLVESLSRASSIHGAGTWLAENKPWQLLSIHFDFIEVISQHFLQYQAPKMAHISDVDFQLYQQVVTSAYQFMDALLGRYIALIPPETTVMICSNHGFLSDQVRKVPNKNIANPSENFREFGMFICAGPNVLKDQLIFGASILDITPTVLQLLDLPVAKHLPGRPLAKIYDKPPKIFEEEYPSFIGNEKLIDSNYVPEYALLNEWQTLGYIAEPAKTWEQTKEHFEHRWLLNKVKIMVSNKKTKEAIVLLTQVLVDFPDHLEAQITLIQCYLAEQELELCQKVLTDISQAGYDSSYSDHLQGQLLVAKGENKTAMPYLERSIISNKSDYRLLERTGQAFLNINNFERAETCYLKALALNPDFSLAYNGLGLCLAKQNMYQDAINAYTHSLGLHYYQEHIHVQLGLSLAALGQLEQAIQAVNNAILITPNYTPAKTVLTKLTRALRDKQLTTNELSPSHK